MNSQTNGYIFFLEHGIKLFLFVWKGCMLVNPWIETLVDQKCILQLLSNEASRSSIFQTECQLLIPGAWTPLSAICRHCPAPNMSAKLHIASKCKMGSQTSECASFFCHHTVANRSWIPKERCCPIVTFLKAHLYICKCTFLQSLTMPLMFQCVIIQLTSCWLYII